MTYRVVQWATGAMGRACLRGALDRTDLDVVGAFVYDPDKIGRDLGELVRRPPIGVVASGSIDDILALDADVVIHATRLHDTYDGHDDDIVRLLASGANVISINGNTFPPHWSADRRRRISTACRDGGASFMGAGLDPGFVVEQLTAVATGVCLDVSRVAIRETVMCDQMRSPEYVFGLLGFGSRPGQHDPNSDEWTPGVTLNAMFEEVVAGLCHRLNFHITGVERSHRMLASDRDLTVATGPIPAGTVSHLDWCWRGVVGTTPVVELRIDWAMDHTHLDDRNLEGWQIRIDGTPSVNLRFGLELPEHLAGRTSVEQLALAGVVLNSIAHVVDAEPGPIIGGTPTIWRQ